MEQLRIHHKSFAVLTQLSLDSTATEARLANLCSHRLWIPFPANFGGNIGSSTQV